MSLCDRWIGSGEGAISRKHDTLSSGLIQNVCSLLAAKRKGASVSAKIVKASENELLFGAAF